MAMVTFRTDRFSLLISPFFAFAAATGFILVLHILYQNVYIKKFAIFFGLLIFSYLCFSAVTAENAVDSLDLPTHQSRNHFTQPEMSAFNFIPQFVEYNSTIDSDYPALRMFDFPYFSKSEELNLPSYYAKNTLDANGEYSFWPEFFLLRNQELVENGLNFQQGTVSSNNWFGDIYTPTPDILSKFSDMTYNSQKIYDNRKVSILKRQQ
jgi:hypothetical protein